MHRMEFVLKFGEEQANAIEEAARSHNGDTIVRLSNSNDYFLACLLRCIDFRCIEEERFRNHHGITVPYEDIKNWVLEKDRFASFEGEIPPLPLLTGRYDSWLANKEEN